ALHCAADPAMTSTVQALPSLQDLGQFPSHFSLPSTTPLPQVGEQSLSFVALHPGAQQPSPLLHCVMTLWLQLALHCAADPAMTSTVQALPSSHELGQFPSHFSLPSTVPLPQLGEQSLSFWALQPGAQQPSPFLQRVMGL